MAPPLSSSPPVKAENCREAPTDALGRISDSDGTFSRDAMREIGWFSLLWRQARRCQGIRTVSDNPSGMARDTEHDYAFEMAASAVRFGVGVTREVGADLAELGSRKVL